MQVYLTLDARDSGFDAVHAHTPGPNRDNFPLRFEWAEWDVPAPAILREFLAEPEWQLGRSRHVPGIYVVRPRPGQDDDGG